MKRSRKPVRKCHGCGLNLGDRCGVYEFPHDMWHHRSCPGFNNQEQLKEFLERQEKQRLDERKERRREAARQKACEPHHQGTLPYANR